MKQVMDFFKPNIKNIIEKQTTIDSLEYERFYFTKNQIKKLKKLGFPLDINEKTLITELHIKDIEVNFFQLKETIRKIVKDQEGYTIGLSWIAPVFKRFGFNIENISEAMVKEFPTGLLVQNQDKIAKHFIEEIERLRSRQDIETEEGVINTLNDEEKNKLDFMEKKLLGYERIVNKKGGKLDYPDVKLAWIENKDFK